MAKRQAATKKSAFEVVIPGELDFTESFLIPKHRPSLTVTVEGETATVDNGDLLVGTLSDCGECDPNAVFARGQWILARRVTD